MMANGMRGLTNFISELRNAQTKDAELKRVNKELAHIRNRFMKDTHLKGYDRKKYICKLLYIFMLGYEFDFGHVEAVNLLSSPKYSEKQIGHLACSLLLQETDDLARLIINSMQKDMVSKSELFQCLSLSTVANIGGKEMAESLHGTVERLLVGSPRPQVRKRAAMALLRLYRKYPDVFDPSEWKDKAIALLDERNLGVVTATLSLLTGLVSNGVTDLDSCVPKVIKLLARIVINREYPPEYVYYGVASPWLQCKALRLLQYFEPPTEALSHALNEVLKKIITNVESTKSTNKKNAAHAVLVEAINTVIHVGAERELLIASAQLLGSFLTLREPNIRYLGLETMARLAMELDDPGEHVRKHHSVIFASLRDHDISIRRQALNLIYGMCDRSNAEEVVSQLLDYLPESDYEIREELVLKIAILAEKFANDLSWYFDVVLVLITQSGEYVSEDVWWRVVQIITNNVEIQPYAAKTLFHSLHTNFNNNILLKVAAFVLGAFGDQITRDHSAQAQFDLLVSRKDAANEAAQAIIVSALWKMGARDLALRQQLDKLLNQYVDSMDVEMQQRACEFLLIDQHAGASVISKVAEKMPPFPDRGSSLVKIIKSRTEATADRGPGTAQQRDDDAARDDGDDASGPSLAGSRPSGAPQQAQLVGASSGSDMLGLGLGMDMGSSHHAAPAAAASSGSGTGDLLADLMGGLGMTSSAPSAPARAAPSAGTGDLLADLMSGAPTSNAGIFGTASATVNEDMAERLMSASEGTLYDDSSIQVTIKTEFHGHQGRALVMIGNKTSGPLTNLTASVPSNPSLRAAVAPGSNMISPGMMVQQLINFECVAAYDPPPVMMLQYLINNTPVSLSLRMPVPFFRFIEPQRMNAEQFFGRWNQVPAEQQVQEIFGYKRPIIVPQEIEVMGNFLTSLKLAVLSGVDPNPASLVAAGLFFGTSQQVYVLLRLESNAAAQKVRLTIRTTNAEVTRLLSAFIKRELSL